MIQQWFNTRHYWLFDKNNMFVNMFIPIWLLNLAEILPPPVTGSGKIYFADDLDVERWTNAFITMYRSVLYTKIQALQFKIMHFTLFTRENLHQWGIVESDVYVFCHEEIETLPHIMIECEVIKIFWTNIYNWLYSKTEINYIPNPKEIIFGIDDPDLTIFNIVYILAKQRKLRKQRKS